MQRNMDLVRMILMRLEDSPSKSTPQDWRIMSFSREEIGYHVHIMLQEGLVEGEGCKIATTGNSWPEDSLTSLTWKGHEFLDLARDQERWNRAKAIIAKVGSAPISVWMKVLTDLLWKSVETAAARSS